MKVTIKVVQNIWGNWACYIGRERVNTFGEQHVAQNWLNDKCREYPYVVSAKSDLEITEW